MISSVECIGLLHEARALTSDASILTRLDDLSLYTRYVELYHDYASAQGKERQTAFEQLFRFIWRIRHTGMVHVKALWRDLPNRDKSVALPALAKYSDPEATNPWKSDEGFTADQIAGFIRDGIANRKLLDFEPVAFSSKLVPATALKLGQVPKGNAGIYLRGVRDFWTWIDKEPATIKLTGKGRDHLSNPWQREGRSLPACGGGEQSGGAFRDPTGQGRARHRT
jgi:hypothetical protein